MGLPQQEAYISILSVSSYPKWGEYSKSEISGNHFGAWRSTCTPPDAQFWMAWRSTCTPQGEQFGIYSSNCIPPGEKFGNWRCNSSLPRDILQKRFVNWQCNRTPQGTILASGHQTGSLLRSAWMIEDPAGTPQGSKMATGDSTGPPPYPDKLLLSHQIKCKKLPLEISKHLKPQTTGTTTSKTNPNCNSRHQKRKFNV